MDTNRHAFQNARQRALRLHPVTPALAFVVCLFISTASAATFSGNARVEVADSTGGLSWNSGNSALSVSCWFKMVIPSGTNLTEDMTILVNRRGGTPSDAHAYRIFFNINSGNIEFTARGANGYTNVLIERPYLERWYHVAVVREGEVFTGYADGRQVFSAAAPQVVGDARSTDGLSIGGWGANRYLYGEVQEVAVYQSALDRNSINQYMFSDQPTNNEPGIDLKGYFKLGYAATTADSLRNQAPAPVPTGSEAATIIGPVQFEEANQAGEQSTFDSRRNDGRDALSPLSGAFSWSQTAFARPTPGVAFELRAGYSSANAFGGFKLGNADPYASGVLGKGWRHTFETRIVPSQDFLPQGTVETIGLMSWDGAIETWDGDTDEFGGLTGAYRTRHREFRGELYLTNSFCEWRTPERLIYKFRRPDSSPLNQRGLLVEIRDFNTNAVQILRNNSGTITQVVDSARGTYNFQYRGSLLTNVAFGPWQVSFAYDSTNRLISKSITNTSGLYANVNTTWQFAYSPSNGLLERIIDPRGFTNMLVQYDKYGRKTNDIDALGRATQTRYGVPGKRQITRLDPATNSWIETYDRKGRILAQTDPLTNTTSYTYDDAGNRTSITEPLGWQTFFGYDARANVIARTNALREITRWGFHSFFNKATNEIDPLGWTNSYVIDSASGNLLRHYDDLGTLVSYTYASNGLVLTSTDANTNITRFAYDTNGFLITRTDPAMNTTLLQYNEVGWKLAARDALYNWTDYDYDLNGNVVRVTDPLFRRFYKTFDGNGNLLAASDGKGRFTTNVFDVANQKIATVDRTGTNVTRFAYTSRGKLERTTNALGHVTTFFYDAANRLTNVTDALGNSAVTEYDANGNGIAMIDKVAQRWTKTFDRLNRVIAESDPQGDTRRTTFDAAGRIQQVFTPLGYPSTHAYDGRGRLTNWVDAENFAWRYTYDGNANIIDIEDALHGHYVMSYGPRNERRMERNQDTNTWLYVYDELLRLEEQRDPNGTVRTLQYDEAGRLDRVDFNTGRYHTFVYDDNNNPEIVTRRDSGAPPVPTRFMYDLLDRPIEQSDVHRQTVGYGYDALGRITAVTYPGGKTLARSFDSLNRLTGQVFDFGPQKFTNTYAYDKADRLIARTYPNRVVQSNAFDTVGRITGLSHLASGIPNPASNQISIALSYAYDRNGNKTAGTEKGTLDWKLPPLTDETANYTAAGKLKTRSIHTNAPGVLPSPGGEGQGEGGLWSYQYDPSGNLTNASLTGPLTAQSWALTYDEDNRTTAIRWTTSAQTTTVLNRYDALGRRVSRTLNGSETDYVLDLSGGMERILCDLDAAGAITAWYVHGPDLAFKISADGALTCYHADAQANIIALSGTNGALLAQYAFTPYGRLLGISNLQSQISNPYTFVGSQGVMEELPGLYFMRARYYSAEAGVFLSTDPVKNIGPGWKPTAFNYTSGNPLSQIDPEGEFAHILIGAAIGIAVSGGIDALSQAQSGGWESVDWNHVRMKAALGGIKGAAAALTGGLSLYSEVALGVTENAVDNAYYERDIFDGALWAAGTSAFSYGVSKSITVRGPGPAVPMEKGIANGMGIGNTFGANSVRGIQEGVLQNTVSASMDLHINPLPSRVSSSIGSITAPSSRSTGSGGSSGGQSLSSRTASSGSYAQSMTASHITSPAPSTRTGGVTTPAVSSNRGGNSITQTVRNVASNVAQSISNAVRSIGNAIGRLFGR